MDRFPTIGLSHALTIGRFSLNHIQTTKWWKDTMSMQLVVSHQEITTLINIVLGEHDEPINMGRSLVSNFSLILSHKDREMKGQPDDKSWLTNIELSKHLGKSCMGGFTAITSDLLDVSDQEPYIIYIYMCIYSKFRERKVIIIFW